MIRYLHNDSFVAGKRKNENLLALEWESGYKTEEALGEASGSTCCQLRKKERKSRNFYDQKSETKLQFVGR